MTRQRATSARMLSDLAELHGIGPEVAHLLQGRPRQRIRPFNELLVRRREALCWTRRDVHRRCHIALSTISQFENGHAKSIGIRTLHALAYGYRLEFHILLIAALRDLKE